MTPEAGWYADPAGTSTLRYWDGSYWTEHVKNGDMAEVVNLRSSTAETPPDPAPPPPPPPPPSAVNARPQPRLIRSPEEAEHVAAEWLRWFGFADAQTTGRGADGGVDVRGRSMVAQVKMHMVPVARPDLQRLYGVATTEDAVSVFFSLTDYTRDAKEWADQVGMALFRFSPAGEAEPVNSFAATLMQRGESRLVETQSQRSTLPGLEIGCSDAAASQALTPRRTGLRRPDQVVWIRQGWLPFASLIYDYTYMSVRRKKQQQLFAQRTASIELVSGSAIATPASSRTPPVSVDEIKLLPRFQAEDLVEAIRQEWSHLTSLRQPAAIQRSSGIIRRYALPPDAVSLKVTLHWVYVLPFFAALISGSDGNRVEVVEGVTGAVHPRLSATFTHHAPEIIDQLHSGRPVG